MTTTAGNRLTDRDVAQIREMAAKGERVATLASRFGISRAYAHDLIAGRARRGAQPSTTVDTSGATAAAVDAFVGELGPLTGSRAVVAQLARALAGRMDALSLLESAASASAAERVAGRLVETLRELSPDESQAALARVEAMLRPLRGAGDGARGAHAPRRGSARVAPRRAPGRRSHVGRRNAALRRADPRVRSCTRRLRARSRAHPSRLAQLQHPYALRRAAIQPTLPALIDRLDGVEEPSWPALRRALLAVWAEDERAAGASLTDETKETA